MIYWDCVPVTYSMFFCVLQVCGSTIARYGSRLFPVRVRIFKIACFLFHLEVDMRRTFCFLSSCGVLLCGFLNVFKNSLDVRDIIQGSFCSEAFFAGSGTSNHSGFCFIYCSIFFGCFIRVIDGGITKEYFTTHASASRGLRVL